VRSNVSGLVVLALIVAAGVGVAARAPVSTGGSERSEMEMTDSKRARGADYTTIPHLVDEVTVETGRFHVVGDLILPADGERHPVIVFVWGSGPVGREDVPRPSRLLTMLLESGFGVFLEDKPGTGASTGEFTPGRLLRERAGILAAEIAYLRGLPGLEHSAIGVYGSSQASYVVGLALDGGAKIDFLVAVSFPTAESVDQSAYLVEQQLLCEGYGEDEAAAARTHFVQRERATTYPEYLEAAEFLHANPVVRDELEWGGVVAGSDFTPPEADSEDFYDPSGAFARLHAPVLALFAEHDTQVDAEQGARAFSEVVRSLDDGLSRVVIVPGADHNMQVSETGCLKEQRLRYSQAGGSKSSPEFLEDLEAWLLRLGACLKQRGTGPTPSE
jgi:pimeloyl-ACP methyl ester carboxylesterase